VELGYIKMAVRIQIQFLLTQLEKCWNGMDKNSNVKICNSDKDLSKENKTTGKGGPTPTNRWD